MKRMLTSILILLGLSLLSACAYAAVNVNAITFPDENFRKIAARFDRDDNGVLDNVELERATTIDCSECGIENLYGINYFTSLTYLDCSSNPLKELKVSDLPTLVKLHCTGNKLKQLDVTSNHALEELWCDYNALTALNVAHNPLLKELRCANNQLTELNLSFNRDLTLLKCDHNQLTGLNLASNDKLTHVYCYANVLTGLDVSHCPDLYILDCNYNKLRALDVSKNYKLYLLDCSINQIPALDVSHHYELSELNCAMNRLASLDITHNSRLSKLNCHTNQYDFILTEGTFDLNAIPGFDCAKASNWSGGTVSRDGRLTPDPDSFLVTYTYDCGKGQNLEFSLARGVPVDQAHFPDDGFRAVVSEADSDGDGILSYDELKNTGHLGCTGRDIYTLAGIEYFFNLSMLWCDDNRIVALDLSHNPRLSYLVCGNNRLAALDVSNTRLSGTNIYDNRREITVVNDGCDLMALPGLDPKKLSNVSGGTVSGGMLTPFPGVSQVSYVYDCGNGVDLYVTLNLVRALGLPAGVVRIESEAFLNVPAQAFLLPDNIACIAPDAFPKGSRLYYCKGSKTETYCQNHGGELPECLPYPS